MTTPYKKSQLELPLVATGSSEQLDIACHELSALESRLASEGRFVFRLDVRKGGYRVTIQKRRHVGQQTSHH